MRGVGKMMMPVGSLRSLTKCSVRGMNWITSPMRITQFVWPMFWPVMFSENRKKRSSRASITRRPSYRFRKRLFKKLSTHWVCWGVACADGSPEYMRAAIELLSAGSSEP